MQMLNQSSLIKGRVRNDRHVAGHDNFSGLFLAKCVDDFINRAAPCLLAHGTWPNTQRFGRWKLVINNLSIKNRFVARID